MGQRKGSSAKPYTAIIYFHGIGKQRRYEEISRLIDGLDQYSFHAANDSLGDLRKQRHEIEPGREGVLDDVEYISASRIAQGAHGSPEEKAIFRIYEAYWSHTLAGGYSGLRVFLWVVGRNPFGAIFQAWRAKPRLKLARLYRMYSDLGPCRRTGLYMRLEAIYHDFENWPARRKYKRGSFREFVRYIKERQGNSTCNDEIRTAQEWHRKFLIDQLMMSFISATLLCAFLEILGFAGILLYKAASSFVPEFPGKYSSLKPILRPDAVFYAAVSVVLIYILIRANAFLSMYVSDVMFWTTSDEKDSRYRRREEILKTTSLTVRHVLADPRCKRVVIVGHSLGSAIAYETLLGLGRARRARRGRSDLPTSLSALGKVTDFVTLGSPIQLISTLFERRTSQYHRYNRIADARRASTDDDPFRRGKGIRWVNVSDPADPISSSIFSVRGRLPNNPAIYEWKTASGHVSMPLSAHSGYFRSKDVLKLLFSVCITRQSASRSEWHSVPVTSKFLRMTGGRIAWLLCAGAVWVLPIYLCAEAAGYATVSASSAAAGAMVMVGLTGLVAFGRLADRLWPLQIGIGVDSKAVYDENRM